MERSAVSKSEFKAKAREFFRQVEASGESVIVTDHQDAREAPAFPPIPQGDFLRGGGLPPGRMPGR